MRPLLPISREDVGSPDSKRTRVIPGGVRRNNERGFTLIELLITVAIVGILAALVMSNWPHLRLITQRSTALNNMRAIGVAFHMYANEHDGVLPNAP